MSLPRLFLESLEPRIAPAVIYAGPVSAGSTAYPVPAGSHNTYQYGDASNNAPAHPVSTLFGKASAVAIQPGTGTLTGFTSDNYFIPLKSGDTLLIYTPGSSGGFGSSISVAGGAAEVFFTDYNHDGVPQANEISGISLSSGAKIALSTGLNVNGDIVDNLIAKTLSNPATWTISADNLISNKQSIGSITMSGNVGSSSAGDGPAGSNPISGSIIAGGSISNVSAGIVYGTVQSGLTAANTYYTFGGYAGVGFGDLTQFSSDSSQGNGLLPAAKLTGGSLSNITVGNSTGLYAGAGGAGAAGGSIANVTLTSDATGMTIQGGNGGAGLGSSINGGAGGAVSQVVIKGVADSSNNDLILIAGGVGGDAISGSAGAGGSGGAVSKVWVGYEYSGKAIVASTNLLQSDVTVQGGDGGAGATAGNGGAVTNTTLLTATPLSAPGAFDIQVLGGDGGTLFTAGKKAGSGGSVTTFNIQDDVYGDPLTTPPSTVYVAGGDASAGNAGTPVLGTGAVGGSVINTSGVTLPSQFGPLTGESFIFQGGNGSNTQSGGGAGGSVSNLNFGWFADEYLQSLIVNSGSGGSSFTGNGGAGGTISGISAPNSTLTTLSLTAGTGGDSLGNGTTGGIGGAGGSINSTTIFDSGTGSYVSLSPQAGNGGDGFKGGGAGGSMQSFNYFIKNDSSEGHTAMASLAATAGDGGSVLGATGSGGKGGSLSGIAFSALVPDAGGNTQTATLIAGFGGDSSGTGTAGAGGAITNANLQVQDAVNLVAGTGGSSEGNKGKIGAGGSIGSSTIAQGIIAKSLQSSVTIQAGDAGAAALGTTPSTGAAGGSIFNASALALGSIAFQAGAGSIGGNGGDISQVAFTGAAGTLGSTGTLSVIAGSGGDAISSTTLAGRGGNVTNASGYTSTDTTAADAAIFLAGSGGTGGKAGAGGSFTGLSIYGGEQAFSVQAGDGGSGTAAAGLGGSVNKISSSASVIVNAIAAGNGGNITSSVGGSATVKAALGGSVTNVNVAGDIGIRTGENYGFATDGSAMGGIFAGIGGVNGNAGALPAKTSGLAGNVTNITAQAISTIVAGRAASPQLVNKVDALYLGGSTALTTNLDGSYSNFYSANLVGGKAGSPTTGGADYFQTTTGFLTPSGSGSSAWTLGTTDPLDGLIAALTLTQARNFTPTAFLTTDSSQTSGYGLYLPTVPLAV
jgi:hypothetical protein